MAVVDRWSLVVSRSDFANNAPIRGQSTSTATLVSPRTRPRFRRHANPPGRDINCILFNRLPLAFSLPFPLARAWGLIMETMLQGLVIIGGLTFSLAASLLIEELIFGQIVRVAFARRAESPKQFSEHAQKN